MCTYMSHYWRHGSQSQWSLWSFTIKASAPGVQVPVAAPQVNNADRYRSGFQTMQPPQQGGPRADEGLQCGGGRTDRTEQ